MDFFSKASPIRRVLFAQSFVNIASSIISNPVLPLYYRSAGATIEQLGLLTRFNYLGYSVFEPTLGFLSDKIGRKRLIASSVTLQIFLTFSYTLFQDIQWFYIISFLNAVCHAGYLAPSRALIADITPTKKRGLNYGSFLTVQSLGRVFGPTIGGFIVYNINYKFAFYVSSALMLISVVNITIFYPKDTGTREKKWVPIEDIKKILTTKTFIFIASRALPFFVTFYSTLLVVTLKESPALPCP